ncbi:MAG TPA: glycosyltransferase family 2 protein [Candidatus Bathyarchaeia archaeon]|nr:glycosyltransferase family 2 protein [Candidatus Bathyarchaeia archaeon]
MAEPQRIARRPPPAPAPRGGPARPEADSPATVHVSLVVPLHNERESLALLLQECEAVLDDPAADWSAVGIDPSVEQLRWEIVFVDDGSTDGSFALLRELAATHPAVRALRLRRNLGKAAALSAGFAAARGEIVVSLDADLQDDPREIPRMLDVLALGFDLVSGWKRKRHDSRARVVASRLFNLVVGFASGIELHDQNCGFKAYRRWVTHDVRIYGELHRFIPVIAAWKGYRVGEIEVQHRPRRFGHSRYGWGRALRGMMDLVTVMFLTRFDSRPAHFFSLPGAFLATIGFAILSYITYLRVMYGGIMSRHPLLIFGVLLVLAGLQLFTSGLLGEMLAAQLERSDSAIIRERID